MMTHINRVTTTGSVVCSAKSFYRVVHLCFLLGINDGRCGADSPRRSAAASLRGSPLAVSRECAVDNIRVTDQLLLLLWLAVTSRLSPSFSHPIGPHSSGLLPDFALCIIIASWPSKSLSFISSVHGACYLNRHLFDPARWTTNALASNNNSCKKSPFSNGCGDAYLSKCSTAPLEYSPSLSLLI